MSETPSSATRTVPELPSFGAEQVGRFFEPAFLDAACAWTGIPPEVRAILDAEAGRFRGDARLRERFWFYHDRLFRQADHPGYYLVIRDAERELGDPSSVLHVLLFFSGMPGMIEEHRRLGVSEAITRDTLADLMIKFREHKAHHGVWGMKLLGWLYLHLRGRIFQLGRLQFMEKGFEARLAVWRHRASGKVVALSDGGISFRGDGQVDGAAGVYDGREAWTSVWLEDADSITGNPIERDGKAVNREERLRRADWECVLKPGVSVLDVHIPSGSPMEFEACQRSMEEAVGFFAKHFPGKRPAAYTCVSWLMDNQLPFLLPGESNVIRFQKLFHLYPVEGASGAQTFERVFGRETELARLPRDTRMRRELARHLEGGGHFHHGGGFRLIHPRG